MDELPRLSGASEILGAAALYCTGHIAGFADQRSGCALNNRKGLQHDD